MGTGPDWVEYRRKKRQRIRSQEKRTGPKKKKMEECIRRNTNFEYYIECKRRKCIHQKISFSGEHRDILGWLALRMGDGRV